MVVLRGRYSPFNLAVFNATLDHGLLLGLGDDDHTQYIKDAEFTQDSGFLVGTAAGTFQEETGATVRASLGLTIGTNVQAYDAYLDSIDQDLGTGDSPTFAGATLSDLTEGSVLFAGAGGVVSEDTTNFVYDATKHTLELGDDTNYNLLIGVDVFNNDSGQYNVGIGYQAGYNNDHVAGSTGYYNVYIGGESGTGVTPETNNTGFHNIGVGYRSLYKCTSGYDTMAIGKGACYAQTTGIQNTAIGTDSLHSNETGTCNIAVGHNALFYNLRAQNTAIGFQSLFRNTYGNENTAIGYQSGYWNQSGDNNVFIGKHSGGYGAGSTQSELDDHVCIGAYSGYNLADTSELDVFIGYKAGYRQTTLSNLLIIDNRLRADVATELTNAIIYGVMADAPADQTLRVNAILNVTENIQIDGTQVVGARVVDARCDDALNSGDATTDGVIDALRDAMITHGLIAAA